MKRLLLVFLVGCGPAFSLAPVDVQGDDAGVVAELKPVGDAGPTLPDVVMLADAGAMPEADAPEIALAPVEAATIVPEASTVLPEDAGTEPVEASTCGTMTCRECAVGHAVCCYSADQCGCTVALYNTCLSQ